MVPLLSPDDHVEIAVAVEVAEGGRRSKPTSTPLSGLAAPVWMAKSPSPPALVTVIESVRLAVGVSEELA